MNFPTIAEIYHTPQQTGWAIASLILLLPVCWLILRKVPGLHRWWVLALVGLVLLKSPYTWYRYETGNITPEEGSKYFNYLCTHYAGKHIYQHISGVDGLVQMKPRDWPQYRANAHAKGLEEPAQDQYGMVDPYGAMAMMDSGANTDLLELGALYPDSAGKKKDLYFLETKLIKGPTDSAIAGLSDDDIPMSPSGWYRLSTNLPPEEQTTLFWPNGTWKKINIQVAAIDKPTARYGYTWQDISTHTMRQLWIAGGRLQIIDRTNNKVVAETTGFTQGLWKTKTPWGPAGEICPGRHTYAQKIVDMIDTKFMLTADHK